MPNFGISGDADPTGTMQKFAGSATKIVTQTSQVGRKSTSYRFVQQWITFVERLADGTDGHCLSAIGSVYGMPGYFSRGVLSVSGQFIDIAIKSTLEGSPCGASTAISHPCASKYWSIALRKKTII